MAASHAQSTSGAAGEQRTPIRILCVDDSRDVAGLMRRVIDAEPDMRCVGCLDSADRLVDEIRGGGADVVLLDATMPGKPPMEAMRELAVEFPAVRTLIFSGYDDRDFQDSAIDAGAWGCVSKDDDAEVVLQALRHVAGGKVWLKRSGR